jgi:hypothetical protein
MNHLITKILIFIIAFGILTAAVVNSDRPVTAEALPDNKSASRGLLPVSPPDAVFAPRSPFGTGASFYHVPGSVFVPTDSLTLMVTGYYGCFYLDAGYAYALNAPLEIPDGARLVELRMFYHDTSAGGMDGWIYRYNDLSTTMESIAYVESVGDTGHSSSYTTIDHTVDNFNYKYVLMVRINGATSDLQLCGMRVAYYP